jgi:hypothetical protein
VGAAVRVVHRVAARAVDAVLGPRTPPPAGVSAERLPPGVVFRSGRLAPAIGGVLARMRGPAAAVTLGRTIVVHPEVAATPRLVAHELEHVRQWEADRLFPLRYTLETLRRGYRHNRYEVEARAAEAAAPSAHPTGSAP